MGTCGVLAVDKSIVLLRVASERLHFTWRYKQGHVTLSQ